MRALTCHSRLQAVRYQGFYEPGAIAPNGFQNSGMMQQNGSVGPMERKGAVKQVGSEAESCCS